MSGIKHDKGKPRLELLSNIWLRGVGFVLAKGAETYAPHNWREGLELSRTLGAALRHILAFQDGEDLDHETGLNHLDHASCELMFARELFERRKDLDDRWKDLSSNVRKRARQADSGRTGGKKTKSKP